MAVPVGIRRRRLLVIGLTRVATVRRMGLGLVLVMHRTATADSVSSTRAQKSPMVRDRRQSKRTGTAAGDKVAEAEGTRGRPSMAGNKTWLGREEDVKRKMRREMNLAVGADVEKAIQEIGCSGTAKSGNTGSQCILRRTMKANRN